jgi:uncharacterized membrane protein (UPF0127 family)
MKKLLLAGLLLFCVLFAHAQSMSVMELTAGFHRIEAEVASTPPTRAQGLMHRREMPQQHGMLFVFTQDAPHCMWMRNTLIPLSVAFLDESGRILNVEEMQPQTEANHCAARPARYALEMNSGWFAQRGLKRGDQIGGIERAPRPQ